jgi:hypothetical protein
MSKHGNYFSKMRTRCVTRDVGVGSVEQTLVLIQIPDLQPEVKAVNDTVDRREVMSDHTYHSTDVPDIIGITPFGLQHYLGAAIYIGLRVVYLPLVAVNRRADIADDDFSSLLW